MKPIPIGNLDGEPDRCTVGDDYAEQHRAWYCDIDWAKTKDDVDAWLVDIGGGDT